MKRLLFFYFISTASCSPEPAKISILTEIDSIAIPVSHSEKLELHYWNDSIYIIDNLYCTITPFNETTNYFGVRRLGLKTGLFPASGISKSFVDDGYLYFLMGYEVICYDLRTGIVNRKFKINFPSTQPYSLMEQKPAPDNPAIYEPDYFVPQFLKISASEFVVSIVSEHPLFNAYNNRKFYSTAKSVARFSLDSGNFTGFIAEIPYRTYKKFYPYFISTLLFTDSFRLYQCYELGHKITSYHINSNRCIKFGKKGENWMEHGEERKGISYAFDLKQLKEDRELKSHYQTLFGSGEWIYRSYISGKNRDSSINKFIQVYKNQHFIGEISIPPDMQPHFAKDNLIYMSSLKKINDSLSIYRLKISL